MKARDELVLRALAATVDDFKERSWRDMQKVIFSHPLAITDAARGRFNVGPFDRAGYAETVMSMSGQRPDAVVGASFSAVFDTANWDRSIAQNAPGQSELPGEPALCGPRARLWAAGEYVPLAFSEREVAANAHATLDAGSHASRKVAHAQPRVSRSRGLRRAGLRRLLKFTLGTCVASGGAWKNGCSLKPNIFAVTLAGNCFVAVLYSWTRSL